MPSTPWIAITIETQGDDDAYNPGPPNPVALSWRRDTYDDARGEEEEEEESALRQNDPFIVPPPPTPRTVYSEDVRRRKITSQGEEDWRSVTFHSFPGLQPPWVSVADGSYHRGAPPTTPLGSKIDEFCLSSNHHSLILKGLEWKYIIKNAFGNFLHLRGLFLSSGR